MSDSFFLRFLRSILDPVLFNLLRFTKILVLIFCVYLFCFSVSAQQVGPEITSSLSGPTQADTIPLTIRFGEEMSGFDAEDISVSNGEIYSFSPAGFVYEATLGRGRGEASDQMDFPLNVSSDRSGNIYVADSENHRIQVFDSTYQLTSVLDSGPGSDNASFNQPADVCVDAAGNIYVADKNNHRVQVFNSAYEYQASLGTGEAGASSSQFRLPSAVLVDEEGNIIVADTENHRIQIFNRNHELQQTIGRTTAG
jgi:DNA-binding beta-propeller fold protein YncE